MTHVVVSSLALLHAKISLLLRRPLYRVQPFILEIGVLHIAAEDVADSGICRGTAGQAFALTY